MQIINVIELIQGNLHSVNSWVVKSEQDKDKKSKLAEEHYLKCIRENLDEHDKNLSDEEILDADSFTNGSGYEITIVWSHNVYE